MLTDAQFQIGLLVLAVIALVLGWVAFELRSLRKALQPTPKDRISNLKHHVDATTQLVATEEGLATVEKFFLTETALRIHLDNLEEEVFAMTEQELEKKYNFLKHPIKGLKNWFAKHKGEIGMELFKKLNDIVKGFIPGGKKEK